MFCSIFIFQAWFRNTRRRVSKRNRAEEDSFPSVPAPPVSTAAATPLPPQSAAVPEPEYTVVVIPVPPEPLRLDVDIPEVTEPVYPVMVIPVPAETVYPVMAVPVPPELLTSATTVPEPSPSTWPYTVPAYSDPMVAAMDILLQL